MCGTTFKEASQGFFGGNSDFQNLLAGLLENLPEKRPYAEQAMQHGFFDPLNTGYPEAAEEGGPIDWSSVLNSQEAEELINQAKKLVLGLDERKKQAEKYNKEERPGLEDEQRELLGPSLKEAFSWRDETPGLEDEQRELMKPALEKAFSWREEEKPEIPSKEGRPPAESLKEQGKPKPEIPSKKDRPPAASL